MIIYVIIIAFLLIAFPVLRCAILHPVSTVFYAVKDSYTCLRYKKYNDCGTGEIVAFCGLFGKGKTLSMVHRAIEIYRKYNGKQVYDFKRQKFVTQRVHLISNVALSVPYEEFVSMQQVVHAAESREAYDEEHDTRTITIIVGDEFSVQMNSRDFKSNFNPLLLNTLLCCRHHFISFLISSQRFSHCDALLRQVTSYVVDCDKIWRFQKNYRYDAWEMENATNVMLLKPFRRECWFVKDKDYNAYDTLACVGNLVKSWKDGDMLSEEEILALQCNNGVVGTEGLVNISGKFKRAKKKQTK